MLGTLFFKHGVKRKRTLNFGLAKAGPMSRLQRTASPSPCRLLIQRLNVGLITVKDRNDVHVRCDLGQAGRPRMSCARLNTRDPVRREC